MVDKSELALKNIFDLIDLNKDGKISQADFLAAQKGLTDAEAKGQFDKLASLWDDNKDGEITFDELKAKYM